MGIEAKINYQLNKFPVVKKVIKRLYQLGMYAISPKIKSEGEIVRVSPDDAKEYFFGYYDKSPWDATGRYMLCMKADDTWSDVSPKQSAEIILIDTENNNKVTVLAKTNSWNVQMGCMLQWLGPDYSSRILYNDFRDGKYVSVILTLASKEEKVIPAPVYSVSADGSFALTLDFSRLYRLRPGYGYYNLPEETANEKLPDKPCIWYVDLHTGEVKPVLKYTDFANFGPRPEMNGAEHKVNHIMLSPNGKRFMVLYRWFQGQRKYTRLVTCNIDGTDMYNLSDDDMVSHCFWKNDNEILAFENKKATGSGYYLMKDKTPEYEQFWSGIDFDGHPSYSPDGSKIVFDRYPDRARVAAVMVSDAENRDREKVKTVARVFAPFKYDNDTRCDLHPRWSRDGKKICFDSVFEGHRGLYVIRQEAENKTEKKKHKILYVFTSCKRSGPVQIMYNLISNMDMKKFEPILITLYDEVSGESDLEKFLSLGIEHYRIPLGKKEILLNRTSALKNIIKQISPNIIHSMGVFPDYAVSRMGFDCQVITLHNYMHEDYTAKFGKIKGRLLEWLQTYAVKHARKVWTCSESLAKMYAAEKHIQFDYIRNGVDVRRFSRCESEQKKNDLRKKLGLQENKLIFAYAGQFIDRKDQEFLLKLFSTNDNLKDYCLLLMGDGVNYELLRQKYSAYETIVFTGNVSNVEDYLRVSDYYISSSRSEGLPTSVLEAMSCGLPVLLSDIMQHREIVEISNEVGLLYHIGNSNDCACRIAELVKKNYVEISDKAYACAHGSLSAETMSNNYQNEYLKVICDNLKGKKR